MDEPDHPLPPSFEPFSLRVVSCARCRQPEVLLAMGQQADDPASLTLDPYHLAHQRSPPIAAQFDQAGAHVDRRKRFELHLDPAG